MREGEKYIDIDTEIGRYMYMRTNEQIHIMNRERERGRERQMNIIYYILLYHIMLYMVMYV